MNELVTVQIPKSALTVVAPAPQTATQRTALDVFGLSADAFLRALPAYERAGYQVGRLGKTRIVDVAQFSRWLLGARPGPTEPAANDDGESAFLHELGMRRVR